MTDMPESITARLEALKVAPQPRQPHPSALPRTFTRSVLLDDIPTDICMQFFVDRLLVGISQVGGGKIGNWLLCEAKRSELTPKQVDYEVQHLLGAGRDDVAQAVLARQILEHLPSQETILLGLSLDKMRGKDRAVIQAIVALVVRVYQEAVAV